MQQQSFTPNDFELLVKVIGIVPELEALAHVAKIAQSHLSYPIVDYEGLLPIFQGEGQSFETSRRRFTFASAQKFFPRDFFPIVSEDDFLTKVYIAIWNGNLSHSKLSALSVKDAIDKMQLTEDVLQHIHPAFLTS